MKQICSPAIVYVFLFSIFALAQESKPTNPMPFQACRDQAAKFCADQKTPRDILKCLIKNDKVISTACKQELERYGRATSQANEQGGGALSAMAGLNSQTPPFPVLAVEGRLSPGTPKMNEEKINLSSPIYQDEDDYFALSAAGAPVHFSDPVTLNSGIEVPKDLYRAELGAQYTHKLPGFKNWGLRGSIGSASDQLFKNFKDNSFSINAQYGFPTETGGFWMLFLYISNNSPLGNFVPIPGVMYLYKTPTFTGMFGFPILSMQWTPEKLWSYSFSMFGPAITAEAGYGDMADIQYITNLSWSTQSFILSNRTDDKDRLTIDEKKASIGLKSFLYEKVLAEVKIGRAIGRSIYIGDGIRNMKRGSQSLDDEGFLALTLKTGF
ncbi:MAG: hypothetical protein H7256_12385 [Bdellovibrio sp.]|nr:hypothetical protein [Bdellovibrio sp.]